MRDNGRKDGLGVIFAIFLGLMVTTFFAVGAFTFYPYPEIHQEALDELFEREIQIRRSRPNSELSEEERQLLDEIDRERRELTAERRAVQERWRLNTSIILIALATATMAVSLLRANALPVVSNGLLLGGLFTMLYGTGWIVSTDSPLLRFLVITIAFAITLAMGYVRFAKRQVRPAAVSVGAGPTASTADIADIMRRLEELERRLDKAARALGDGDDR